MGNIFFKITFLVGIFFLLIKVGYTQPLEIGVFHFPPYYVVDGYNINKVNKNSKVTGLMVDRILMILKKANLDFEWRVYPAKRLYHNIANGKTIFVGIKNVPDYHEQVFYSKTPIVQIILRAYSTGEKQLIRKKEDLVGKNVITISGYGYSGLINFLKDPKNKIKLNTPLTHKSALLMLKAGRGDYLLDYEKPLTTALKGFSMPKLKYFDLLKLDCFFIINKNIPKAKEMIVKLETAHEALLREEKIKMVSHLRV